MIEQICHRLKEKLITLTYFTVFAGRVQTHMRQSQTATGKYETKRIPIAYDVTGIPCEGNFVEIVPNSDYKGLLFFEGEESSYIKKVGSIPMYNANIRLVAWLNFRQIMNTSNIDALALESIKGQILNRLVTRVTEITNEGYSIFSVQLRREILSKQPFQNYSFDESVKPFLTQPYLCFALDLQVTYLVHRTSCIVEPTLVQPIC